MAKKRDVEIPVTASSGNVFADLGFAEPEEELAKAKLASRIRQIIKERRLTQIAAGSLMGVDQPKVSALLNGRMANFSSDRLMRLLTALGQDVDIVLRDKPRSRARGKIRVLSEPHRRSKDRERLKSRDQHAFTAVKTPEGFLADIRATVRRRK
jgi:predicted XRE-type DNA-binding protein